MTQDYIVLNDYEDMMKVLKNREIKSWEIEEHPIFHPLPRENSDLVDIGIKTPFREEKAPINEWAVDSYTNLLGMGCSYDFLRQSLQVLPEVSKEKTNDLIRCYFKKRKANPRNHGVKFHFVKDTFSPEGEVRYGSSQLWKHYPDYRCGNVVKKFFKGDWEFFEGFMSYIMSSFRFLSNAQEEVNGRTIKIGMAFDNSEFGGRYWSVSLYYMDVECSNQFIPNNLLFKERLAHRRKDRDKMELEMGKATINLQEKIERYAEVVKKMGKRRLKLDTIEELIEEPINRKWARVPEGHLEKIIESFNEDPVYDKNGNLTDFSLATATTRYIRDNRELEEHTAINQALDSLMVVS